MPRDGHVHTEWSWDAPNGSMERACARAVDLGVPAIVSTDHADFVTWRVSDDVAEFLDDLDATVCDGVFTPKRLDLDGYLDCVQRCRHQFPDLTIQSAVELGEPHWYTAEANATLDAGQFDLVVAAVHSLAGVDGGYVEVSDGYLERSPQDVVRGYLAEIELLISQWDRFDVLAHIDYAARAGLPASARTGHSTSRTSTGRRCTRSPRPSASRGQHAPATGSTDCHVVAARGRHHTDVRQRRARCALHRPGSRSPPPRSPNTDSDPTPSSGIWTLG